MDDSNLAFLRITTNAKPFATPFTIEEATLAIEHGATLCTTDRDFTRFKGLRLLYPLD